MSPEQVSGRPIDARSAILSFGVVLYELLAGRRPFAGAKDLKVLQNITHGAAPPLSEDVPTASSRPSQVASRSRMIHEQAAVGRPYSDATGSYVMRG